MAKNEPAEKDADQKSFLNRWAERKQSVRETKAAEDPQNPELEPDGEANDLDDGTETGLTEEEIAALPDPETLTETSDFTPFLQQGVPENLKRLALRRLWRVNPLIGEVDGLLDYDLDYTDAATVVKNLQTLYQVGKGMVLEEESEEERKDRDRSTAQACETETSATQQAGSADTADAPQDTALKSQQSDQEPPYEGPNAIEDETSEAQGQDQKRTEMVPLDADADLAESRLEEREVVTADNDQGAVTKDIEPSELRAKAKPGQAVHRRWGAFS